MKITFYLFRICIMNKIYVISSLWLVKEEKQIKDYLKKKMPEYCASVLSAVKRVNLLLED